MSLLRLAVPAAAILLAAAPAHADRRAFTNTYEYMTMPDGETELEIYSTQSRQTWEGDSPQSYALELEVEHGITDHWDVALYHVFEQDDVEAFHFAEFKLETRYRFAQRGEWPVDVEVYGEGVKVFNPASDGPAYEAEAKLILARDFDALTAVVNAIGEMELGGGIAEPELELGWAAGLTYEIDPEWKIGAETFGGFEAEEVDESMAAYAGPSISWAPSTSLWTAITPGFGLTEHSDDINVRLAIGLHIQ